jgi:hypothetical protein
MNTRANFEGTANDSKFFTLQSNINDFERIIYHCPDCYDLPLLKINEDLTTVNSTCNKNHNYNNISIEQLHQKLVDTSISAESIKANKTVVCFKCQTSLELKDSQNDLEKILHGFGFCHGCQNIICYNCLKSHDENEKKKDPNNHKVVPLDKYTNYCPYHRHKYSAYCLDCKKNTCVKCTEHRKHKKYHFDEYLLFDDDVKKYKKEIIGLRTNCENLENRINTILDKIRSDFHEEMQKQINILTFNELLLDAYQINQFNYCYLQNVLNNFSILDNVEKKVSNQDIKLLLVDLINNCDCDLFDQIQKINQTEGELLHVSQPGQMTKQIKLDYNKDTVNPTFNAEGNKSIKNTDNIIMEMTNDSKNSSMLKNNNVQASFKSTKKGNENEFNVENNNNNINNNINSESLKSLKSIKNETQKFNQSIKNETAKSIKSNHNETQKSIKSIHNNNNNNNETKKSIKSSIKKENSSQAVDDLIDSFKANNGGEEIDINDIIVNNNNTQSGKISCEFIGKNYARDSYCLTDIPNNVETVLEIKNTGDNILPKGCYLYDENNCSSLMLLDNVINSIEPGKTIYKQLKFDIYIYSKGSYHVKLAVKDHNGAFISSNKFEYTLVVE